VEIRGANGKSEERLKAKAGVKEMNVPLGYRRWTPLAERVILELESSNPKGRFGCADGGGAYVFLSERGGRGVLQEKC